MNFRTYELLLDIQRRIINLEHNVEKIMSQQDDLNAVGAELEADVTRENTALDTIKAEIATLEANAAAGTPLDFTAVNAALADQGAAVAAEEAVVPPAVAP